MSTVPAELIEAGARALHARVQDVQQTLYGRRTSWEDDTEFERRVQREKARVVLEATVGRMS